jgi:hypothetical protein
VFTRHDVARSALTVLSREMTPTDDASGPVRPPSSCPFSSKTKRVTGRGGEGTGEGLFVIKGEKVAAAASRGRKTRRSSLRESGVRYLKRCGVHF